MCEPESAKVDSVCESWSTLADSEGGEAFEDEDILATSPPKAGRPSHPVRAGGEEVKLKAGRPLKVRTVWPPHFQRLDGHLTLQELEVRRLD